MSIPSLAFTNMFHLDLEFENYSEDIMLSFVPQPVSTEFLITTVKQFDLLYDLMTYDRFAVRDAFPFLNRRAPKCTSALVEVFEDMGFDDAREFSPLPTTELVCTQEFPSFFGQPK
jgi:hypothetical protein